MSDHTWDLEKPVASYTEVLASFKIAIIKDKYSDSSLSEEEAKDILGEILKRIVMIPQEELLTFLRI